MENLKLEKGDYVINLQTRKITAITTNTTIYGNTLYAKVKADCNMVIHNNKITAHIIYLN